MSVTLTGILAQDHLARYRTYSSPPSVEREVLNLNSLLLADEAANTVWQSSTHDDTNLSIESMKLSFAKLRQLQPLTLPDDRDRDSERALVKQNVDNVFNLILGMAIAAGTNTVRQSSTHDDVNLLLEGMKLSFIKSRHRRDLWQSLALPDDWDGDDGYAPAKQDVWNAIKFLEHIPSLGIISADVMIIGDGDVGFDWDKSGRCLEVGFRNAKISFYGQTPDEKELKGTEDFKDGVVPVKLQSLMNANFPE